ncbi:MAG: LCP family protein [Chloroflexota bacterium]
MHVRRIQPETGMADRRRLGGALLSAILPGLGQLANGRTQLAALFAIPSVLLLLGLWIVVAGASPARLLASLMVPSTLGPVLVLNLLILAWRLAAVGQAFADTRLRGRPSGGAIAGLALIALFVVLPHLYGAFVGYSALGNFERVFGTANHDPSATRGPSSDERVNVLLIGVDSGKGRAHALTDTIIVASVDPKGRTVSMISIPRDLVNVPLGNGDSYAPKINSLLAFADRNRAQFPGGGTKALEAAVGALLGIPIHYYAEVNLAGFVRMVDAVGGVDVDVARPLNDPKYGGFGVGPGWSITRGRHHLDGANALAYTRIRKSAGESDFTRAERQQQVLVAVRDAAVKHNILFSLPGLLDAVGDTVRTDMPPDRLPGLAALASEIGGTSTTRAVIRFPLVHPASNRYGDVQVPDIPAIRAVAAALFTPPGTPPTAWPTPQPTKTPRPSAP